MPKPFSKHKLLLDEHLPPRKILSRLNEYFDVKHIKHDLHHGGVGDLFVYEFATKQGRIILTTNVKDFRHLLKKEAPGVIGIPEAWSTERVDAKLTALLVKHTPAYFKGRYISLAVE